MLTLLLCIGWFISFLVDFGVGGVIVDDDDDGDDE